MSPTHAGARARAPRVEIVGLRGQQFTHVHELLATFCVRLHSIKPERLLRYRKASADLIVLTRFVGHKHCAHAESIAPGHVARVDHGTASAVANAIVRFLGLKRNAP